MYAAQGGSQSNTEIAQKARSNKGGVKVSTGIVSKGRMPGVWAGPVNKPARL